MKKKIVVIDKTSDSRPKQRVFFRESSIPGQRVPVLGVGIVDVALSNDLEYRKMADELMAALKSGPLPRPDLNGTVDAILNYLKVIDSPYFSGADKRAEEIEISRMITALPENCLDAVTECGIPLRNLLIKAARESEYGHIRSAVAEKLGN